MTKIDLNRIEIPTDVSTGEPLADYGTSSGAVEVVFRNLESRLIREIESADIVVGCVAWLTSKPILRALNRVEACIIVQKEDFLRPDSEGCKGELQSLYELLGSRRFRFQFWPPLGGMTTAGDPTMDGVRCVGNHNACRSPAFPRAHHKFVVFGNRRSKNDRICTDEDAPPCLDFLGENHGLPWAWLDEEFDFNRVWTGSFNFTRNGGHSLENAVLIRDIRIARAYLGEFAQVAALSEPLDWDAEWCAPEWRIGS